MKSLKMFLLSIALLFMHNLAAAENYNITGSVAIPSGAIADSLKARLLDISGNVVAAVPVVNNQFDFSATAVADDILVPLDYKLSHNFPNPFNPSTRLLFEMKKQGDVKVEIFDVLGRLVDHSEGKFGAGNYTINWSPNNCAAGNYIARVSLGNLVFAEKMQLSDGSGYGTGISIDGGGHDISGSIRPIGLKKAMNEELRLQLVSTDGKYYNRTEKESFNYNGSSIDLGTLKTFEVYTIPGTTVDFLEYCKAARPYAAIHVGEYPFKVFLDSTNAPSAEHVEELKRRIDRTNQMVAQYNPQIPEMYTYDGVTEDPEVGMAVVNKIGGAVDDSYVDATFDDGRTKHGTTKIDKNGGVDAYGQAYDHGKQHAAYAARHPDAVFPELTMLSVMGDAPEFTDLDARFDAVNSFLDHMTYWDIFEKPSE
ncbi:T9SS type A sorting domain-containing protein [bacterium]|nr:T9SS type A sorting domain-containing protein [bacterium]